MHDATKAFIFMMVYLQSFAKKINENTREKTQATIAKCYLKRELSPDFYTSFLISSLKL
jgi:hypothetical protein